MNPDALQTIIRYAMTGAAALLTIMLHEIAHGFVAYKLGDMTAKERGRLSLNPIRHVDLLGLLSLIVIGFGWAKPVPVDMRYFRQPRRDMAIVAFAGPMMNFLLALVAVPLLVLSLILKDAMFQQFFSILLSVNLGLGIFNLFPIPPLDGSKILGVFLPERLHYIILSYERYGMLLLMALLWFNILDVPLNFMRTAALNLYLSLGNALYAFLYPLIGG